MSKKKRKPTTQKIDWPTILVSGVIDLLVGVLLLIAEKILGE